MRAPAVWREAPRTHRVLIAALVVMDAAGLVAVVMATGLRDDNWGYVAVLIPLLILMAGTHLVFYRWQVRRAPRWGRQEEVLAEIVDRAQRPSPRLPDPFRRRRSWW